MKTFIFGCLFFAVITGAQKETWQQEKEKATSLTKEIIERAEKKYPGSYSLQSQYVEMELEAHSKVVELKKNVRF